jgi:hypothetical protein
MESRALTATFISTKKAGVTVNSTNPYEPSQRAVVPTYRNVSLPLAVVGTSFVATAVLIYCCAVRETYYTPFSTITQWILTLPNGTRFAFGSTTAILILVPLTFFGAISLLASLHLHRKAVSRRTKD